MRPVRSLFEIRYQKPASQFLFVDSVIKSFTSEPLGDGSVVLGGSFEAGLKKERAAVLIEPQRIAIDFENFTNNELSLEFFDDSLQKILARVTYPDVARCGFRTLWVQEKDCTIQELVQRFKDVFYKEVALLSEAIDVALPLTLKFEDKKINFNAGPMVKQEFVEKHSRIKDGAGIPEVFVISDVDCYITPNKPMSKKEMLKFAKDSFEYSEQKTKQFIELL